MTHILLKRFPLYGVLSFVLFAVAGCSNGQQYALRAADPAEQVEGELSVSENNLGTTTLEFEVSKLGTDSTGARTHYVAWAKNGDDIVKLGELNVEDRHGTLIATTSMNPFEVRITREKRADVTRPSEATLLESQLVTVE